MTNQYFADPPCGVIGVFSTVFNIAKEHWKTLGLIAALQLLSVVATVLILFLVSMLLAATYIMSLVNAIKSMGGGMNDDYGGGFGRRNLIDYSVGFHGASRLLDGQDYYDNFQMDDDLANLFATETIFVLLAIYLLWMTVLSLVSSLYFGTFMHALANIYTGGFPSVNESMGRGMTQMWNVFFFQVLHTLIISAFFLLMVALPFKSNWPAIFFGFVLFIVSVALTNSLLAGGSPSIVVERKSALKAFGRSIELCKSFVGFIFCTQFSYIVTIIVLSILFNMMFNHLPGALAFIGHLFVNIVSSTAAPM